jgi:DNA polymerase-1
MNCEECPFKDSKKVPGGGFTTTPEGQVVTVVEDRNYDICAVAMAPAREELEQGIVLVGASGQILRKHLYQMGIMDYYACNVLLCPISDDKLVGDAVKCCRDVVEEVRSKHPMLTIALGDLPLHTLAPDIKYSIKECEGRVLPSLVGPMLPLTHPAYYWRHPDEVFDFTECMRSGLRFPKGEYTQADNPTYTVVDENNYQDVLNKLDKHKILAGDVETTGFKAFGWEPDHILELGISVDKDHAYIVPAKFLKEFKSLLEEKKTRWWNAPFDCGFLSQVDIRPNVEYDGMLAHYSIDERPYSHGLKSVSQVYLGTEDWEKDIGRYLPSKKTSSYELIPKEVRYDYLSKDVTRTLYLCDVLDPFVNRKVFDRLLMPACRMFIQIEERGMRVDPVRLMDMENILGKELGEIENEIYKESGVLINPNSPKQVSNLVYNVLGIPVDPFYGFGTSKAYLESFRDSHPIVGGILDYRELSKLKNGYIEQFAKFVDRRFRIHPDIKISAAVTGRLSSANPSIMNIKAIKDLKRIFLPDDGSLMGYFDVKQNELRWYCIIAKDRELTRILQEGGDPHEVVRMATYGEEEDEYKKSLQRTWAKAVVFGRVYKRTRASIERQVGREVIDAVMEAVDSIAPHIDEYYKWIMKEVRAKGYLESYFGRKRRFSLITPDNKKDIERQAVNFPIQSSGSDLMLLCMLHIFEMRDKFGVWPFWPVHDSITMNIPDIDTLYTVQKELEEYSLEIVNGEMPFTWKPDWGHNWALDKNPPEGERVTITWNT